MGYTTDFSGTFDVVPPLTSEHAAYLRRFSDTRRMERDAEITATLPDPFRLAVALPIGVEGGYYVGAPSTFDLPFDSTVLDHNKPPSGQPGLWCQWVPNHPGTALEWDEGEKFYHYEEWLRYLIGHFLDPWGYVLSGQVTWQGEEHDDRGTLHCRDNQVEALLDQIQHPLPSWES